MNTEHMKGMKEAIEFDLQLEVVAFAVVPGDRSEV